MFLKLPISIFDKCLIVMYTSGSMIQVFMLCLCAQELLEAVRKIKKILNSSKTLKQNNFS